MLSMHNTGMPADGPGARLGASPMPPADEPRTARTSPAATRAAEAGIKQPGQQVSFSAQSLQALEAAALAQAARAGADVQGVGDAVGGGILAAARAVDSVGAQASDLLVCGAQALASGIGAVRGAVQEAAAGLEAEVADATRQLGGLASSTVGYGALAALAGGALLDELV